ncbi:MULTISPECIES: PP2C family protein-serine/threonine phosphatase [Nostocales]|uniref:SpoIIE family protein phosphatase n=3 Tax=Nostocales TaxID=1161 RepID=A0A8S9TGN0_9CYAN|nr:protein phosphatase 2C domain-containing protein [Tolypothrix bouteillei]KAF3891047.1 SpoIIE family protein phosphatase [Tolypothrix bouteillei VB521301]
MENDAAMLCPNESCQTPNSLTSKFCQKCCTLLPKRYLWAVADGISVAQPKELLADRYLVISKSVLLDTKPGLPPQTPDVESVPAVRPYLRLFPYRLYVPQVYGVLQLEGTTSREILLLEKPPLCIKETAELDVQLESELTTAWQTATSMRQLNWLWQIAHLWQPLAGEGVASSLLTPEVLRAEGPLVRLLELRYDKQTPNLAELGEFWQQQLCHKVRPAIAEFVKEICRSLISQEMRSAEQLIAVLDKGLAEVGKWQKPTIKISTKSDIGPNRPRNEDSCYPPSGTVVSKPPHQTAIAIVCDGIGGHEGGSVASNLAIETIYQQMHDLVTIPPDHISPANLLEDLERAAAVANDKISQRNDSEHRQGRQRMGTTLVMALPVAHEMYIAHVGDSRAYWITRAGCYQVTLDDDVASREVRLGYATYRDAVQQGASGSLVQALGMSASSSLHPTSQRFIVDEDSVFLLCSDGLSDFDRVEQYWETEILPILDKNLDIASATDKLVEIANNQNGHDNVTIALVHCQVQYSEPQSVIKPPSVDLSTIAVNSRPTVLPQEHARNQKTEVVTAEQHPTFNISPHLVVLPILLSVAALLGLLAWQQDWFSLLAGKVNIPNLGGVPSSPDNSNSPIGEDGRIIVTDRQESFKTHPSPESNIDVPARSILLEIPPASATANNPTDRDLSWVYFKVCSVGGIQNQPTSLSTPGDGDLVSNSPSPRPKSQLFKGQIVKIAPSQRKNLTLNPATQTQRKQCQSHSRQPNTSSSGDLSGETEPPVPTASTQPKPTKGTKNSSEQ